LALATDALELAEVSLRPVDEVRMENFVAPFNFKFDCYYRYCGIRWFLI